MKLQIFPENAVGGDDNSYNIFFSETGAGKNVSRAVVIAISIVSGKDEAAHNYAHSTIGKEIIELTLPPAIIVIVILKINRLTIVYIIKTYFDIFFSSQGTSTRIYCCAVALTNQ